MLSRILRAALLLAALGAGTANAQQQPPANPRDIVPDKMPFHDPYGMPITLSRAMAVVQAAMNEAGKHGWQLDIAVVDSGANLVLFARMEGAQLGSIAIAQHKARAAVKFRRPTKYFEERIQKLDYKYLLTLDDVVASRGGIPLVEDGKIIGGIGCSGGTGSQDELVCEAGVSSLRK